MNKETAINSAIHNTFFLYIANISVQIISIIISIYIIRTLEVEIFGLYNFVRGSLIFIQIFSISAPVTIIGRFIPELVEHKAFRLINKIFISTILLAIILLFFIYILIFLFQNKIGSFFNLQDFHLYTHYIGFFIFSYIFMILQKTYVSTFLLQKKSFLVSVSASILRLILYFIFWKDLNLRIIFLIESIVYSYQALGLMLIPAIYIKKHMPENVDAKIPNLKNRVIRYGALSFFNEFGAGMLNKATSYYVISAMSNAYLLGQYSFADRINNLFLRIFPLNQINAVLKPIFIRKYTSSENKNIALNKMYVFLYKFLFFILAPICFYFVSMSDIIINNVFDPKYISARTITNIIFMFTLFNAFQIPLGYVVQSIEKIEWNLFSKIFVIYNIIGSIFAMKIWGLIGVAIILGTSILFKNLFILFAVRKYVKLSFPFLSLLKISFVSTVLLFLTIELKHIINLHPYLLTVLLFTIFVFFYFIILKIINPFDNEEKSVVNQIFYKMKVGFIKI